MKRTAIENLLKWNQTSDVRPVLITGSKGVGKTYLAYDFAKAFFKNYYYINFEHNSFVREIFKAKDPFLISTRLLEHFHLDTDDSNQSPLQEDRVLILDEIGNHPEAIQILTSLQYTGQFPKIIAISSYPIKKEELGLFYHIPIYPMQFDEFLVAMSRDWYVEIIRTHYDTNKKIPHIVHKELLALHNLYLQVGGMPGIVNEYLSFNNTINIFEQHSLLLGTYQHYLSLINSDSQALKMNQVLNCLPLQLMKNNKKFQYRLIRKGTTHSMYKDAIYRLSEQNYLIPSYKITSEELSNISSIIGDDRLNVNEITSFKLYSSDVGLLNTQFAKQLKQPYDKTTRKALLENYVGVSLLSNAYPNMFWESESTAKVDFILVRDGVIIPIEIFTDKNTRSKSISVLKKFIDFPYSIKISEKNFDYSNNVKYIPYYASFCL